MLAIEIMQPFRVFVFLLLVWHLYGCGRVYKTDADIDEAKFYSPRGEFPLRYSHKHPYFDLHSPAIHGGDGYVSVRMSLFPLYGRNVLAVHNPKIKLDRQNLYCQLNGGKKYYLTFIRLNNQFEIQSPEPMSQYAITGGGLYLNSGDKRNIDAEHKRKMKRETYRCYVPFTIDNDKYAIDVTYRLAVASKIKFGVPGYP